MVLGLRHQVVLTLSWTFGQTVENQPKSEDMVRGHQMANMAGVRKLQPNLHVQPMVIDPFFYQRTRLLLGFTLLR